MKNWLFIFFASFSFAQDFDLNLTTQPLFDLSIEDLEVPPPVFKPPEKSVLISVGLSSLFPGLGHLYLGENKTATALMGSTALSMGALVLSPSLFTSANLQAASGYGLYSVYRDVRNYNGQSNYHYPMPTDSFADLTWASFRWSVLKKPEVWGGFLGAMGLAVTTAYFLVPDEAHIQLPCATHLDLYPLAAFPVGIGEESLFRGCLQSMLAEAFNPTGAIVLSSLAFGAAHIPNAQHLAPELRWRYYSFSLPLITAFGAYFGWMTHKNRSLQESVALHCWYDFVLFAASYAASQAASTKPNHFALQLPF